MRTLWDDLNARARGLATHLLGRRRLEILARTADLGGLARELDAAGYGPVPSTAERPATAAAPGPSPSALEIGLRRGAAARIDVLSRWCGRRALRLAIVFEDEDRRSIRALLRGAFAGAPSEERLAGLIPTPELPEGLLRELARQPTSSALAALLVAWGNPYGAALLPEARGAHPDLFRLELALNREFAARAARTCGRALRPYVGQVIDLENGCTALILAGRGGPMEAEDCYLPGGRLLSRPAFLAASAAPDPLEAARLLSRSFETTPFAEIFLRHGADRAGLEPLLLAAQIRERVDETRRSPLGPSPLLGYLLRLRGEAFDLRRILWGLALGAPREEIVSGLVTGS